MKNMIIGMVIGGVVLVGGSFYAGMKYAQSQRGGGGNFANLSQAERQARFGGQGGVQRGARAGGGFTVGTILSVDDVSLTVSVPGGGSRIILFSTSTPIEKSISGEKTDLKTGEMVTVAGEGNQDGSITAQRITVGNARPVSTQSR